MKIRLASVSLFLLFSVTLLLRCGAPAPEKSQKLLVAAGIAPLADFVKKIGGSKVDVFTIVPPGSNPHTFELTPGMMKKLSRADVLVFNGIGLEFWIKNVKDNLSGSRIVYAAKGLPILSEDEDHHAAGNPHVWLNVQNAVYMVKRIAAAMAQVDVSNRRYYENNAAIYIKELNILDSDIQANVALWTQKKFVCFHPAWAYFAARYGLEQAGVIEERHGMQASPSDIADIIKTVNQIGARVIFAEAQFPSQMARVIAAESGIAVVPLDPLGSQGKKSYVDLMRYNVAQMSKGMK